METGDGGFERLEVLLSDFVVNSEFDTEFLYLVIVLFADKRFQADFGQVPMEILLIVFWHIFPNRIDLILPNYFFFLDLPFQPFPFPLRFFPIPPTTNFCPLLQIKTEIFIRIETAACEFWLVDDILEGFRGDFQRFLVQKLEVFRGEVLRGFG